jgi:transcriptional regulator with XRE-family HTH domain
MDSLYAIMKNTKKSSIAMELRKKAGLSRTKVASALGVAENTVARWERYESVPHLSIDKVDLLTDLYGCSLKELVRAFSPSTVELDRESLSDDEMSYS